MIKEKYTNGNDVATIEFNEGVEFNPYKMKIEISFADYESCRATLEQMGFPPFKKIINE